MPPVHRNVEIPTIMARVMNGVIHACDCGGLTTSVAGGTGMRGLDLTASACAVVRVRLRLASASLARSSSIVAAAAARAELGLSAGAAWEALVLLAPTSTGLLLRR